MGLYIDPYDMTKEEYLETHGERIYSYDPKEIWDQRSNTELPVVLIDNGNFTAAGVAYSLQELRRFLAVSDFRPKIVYMMDLHRIAAGSDHAMLKSYLRHAGTPYIDWLN